MTIKAGTKSRTCVLVLAGTISSCSHGYVPHAVIDDRELQAASEALDNIKWYVDAYGGASLSSPMLVQPDDSFKFGLTKLTPDDFFRSEKDEINGRSAGVVQSANVSGASVTAAVDVTALQQYAAALDAYRQNLAVVARKQQLLNRAAVDQYRAALDGAAQIADKAQREAAIADATKQLAQSLSGPAADATVAPPTAPGSPALPSIAAVPNAAAGLLPALAAPQALFAAGTPAVSGETRSALVMAAGDTATLAMLGLLGNPSAVAKFKGKRILFGVSMVSLEPGWKTKTGYAAVLQAHVRYRHAPARSAVRDGFLALKNKDSPLDQAVLEELQSCVVHSLTRKIPDDLLENTLQPDAPSYWLKADRLVRSEPSQVPRFEGSRFAQYLYPPIGDIEEPVVEAASPMGDAQTLDLQASVRAAQQRALQLAFLLTAAGYGASASAFMNFARQEQQDIETHTNNVVVSAYSATDGSFGFTMYPRVTADPARKRASERLSVPTFPTLLVIGTDDEQLRPRVAVRGDDCFVVEPQLEVYTSTRWTPDTEPCRRSWRDQGTGCVGMELTAQERVGVAHAFYQRLVALQDKYKASMPPGIQTFSSYLRREGNLLLRVLSGTNTDIWFPVELILPPQAPSPPKPSVDLAAPDHIDLVRDASGTLQRQVVQMVLAGTDLDQVDTSKVSAVGPVTWLSEPRLDADALAPNAKVVGKAIQLVFRVDGPGAVVFTLPIKGGAATITSKPLIANAPRDMLVIEHSKSAAKDRVIFTPGTPEGVIKSEIEKDKTHYPAANADVKVDVQADSHK